MFSTLLFAMLAHAQDADPSSEEADPPVMGVIGAAPEREPREYRVFHVTELLLRRRIAVKYPKDARGTGDVDCRVRVFTDARGRPERVEPAGCPEAFVSSAEASLLKWRWAPPRWEGDAVKAQFLVTIAYVDPTQPSSR